MYLYDIIKLSKKIEKNMNEYLKEYKITFLQWQLLRALYVSNTSIIGASKISKGISKDKRLVSISFKRLEELHYIQRVTSVEDKREKYVSITDNGLSICELIYQYEQFYNEEILSQNPLNKDYKSIYDETNFF